MSFGDVLNLLYDHFGFVLISIMTQLCDIFSFILRHIIIGIKETNTIKNTPCQNTTSVCLLLSAYVFH